MDATNQFTLMNINKSNKLINPISTQKFQENLIIPKNIETTKKSDLIEKDEKPGMSF